MVVFTAAPFSLKTNHMAKKTYRTFFLKKLQILFKDDEGRRVEVEFRSGIQIDSTAKFSTSDPAIQDMMEKSSGFGRDYYLESVKQDPGEAAPATVKESAPAPAPEKQVMDGMKDSRRFRNLVEMKNAMKELGIELEEDANYSKAKAAAAKAGYDFQIQKK